MPTPFKLPRSRFHALRRRRARFPDSRGHAACGGLPRFSKRSLAYAVAAAEEAGALIAHVRVDERVAAFTALGIAKASRLPVGLVCTSGTALGEYLPAVMEAYHAGVPLAIMSADRPVRLRGTGANQTTVQTDFSLPLCVQVLI